MNTLGRVPYTVSCSEYLSFQGLLMTRSSHPQVYLARVKTKKHVAASQLLLLALGGLLALPSHAQRLDTPLASDSALVRAVFDEALSAGEAHENLRVLCKDIGHRLSGSPSADQAMAWGEALLKNYGADEVRVMPVTVPSWTRGTVAEATGHVAGDAPFPLHITALGGSIPTPHDGVLEAPLLVVKHLDALDTLDARGHIVLFNRAMDTVLINTGSAYGGAYDQRGQGAVAAAKAGAVGVLVRSLTHSLDTLPHTGAMHYDEEVPRIPAAAISTVDARALARLVNDGHAVRVQMQMNCRDLGEVTQGNVIGVWKGSQHPDQIITLGGHLDSWDIGEGAHDDGAGIVHTIETLRILKAVGYEPLHTLHFVLFINEENGNRGGKTYAAQAASSNETHIAAMESDAGGFVPRGVRMDGSDDHVALVRSWADLLEPYNLHFFGRGGSGVDIGPLKELTPRPLLIGLVPDGQRYFDFHHSSQDVWENVHKRELELGAATCATFLMMLDRHWGE